MKVENLILEKYVIIHYQITAKKKLWQELTLVQIFLHWNVVYVNREREEGDEGGERREWKRRGKRKGREEGKGLAIATTK